MTKSQVGEMMSRRRATLKLTAREAARAVDLAPTTWSDLERGKHPPSDATQRAVARALGWRIDWHDLVGKGASEDDLLDPNTDTPTLSELRARVEELEQYVHLLMRERAAVLRDGDVEIGGEHGSTPAAQ